MKKPKRKISSKKHKITCMRYEYFITCGKCKKEFKETGQNHLTNDYPFDIDEGEWIECPHCQKELQIKFNE